jgi:hypothetical protein
MVDYLDATSLFEPVQIGNLRLLNRIAMSPMTREFAINGVLPPEAAALRFPCGRRHWPDHNRSNNHRP